MQIDIKKSLENECLVSQILFIIACVTSYLQIGDPFKNGKLLIIF